MLSLVFLGVSLGCVYALMAIGISSVYRTTGVLNFAQGTFVMFGAMTCTWLLQKLGLPYLPALALALLLCGLIGGLVAVLVVVPLWRRRSAPFMVILATLVVSLMIENLVLHWLGAEPRSTPAFTSGNTRLLGTSLPWQYAWVIGGTLLIVIAFRLFLTRTLLGKAMQACAIDLNTSSLLGIDPTRIAVIAFVMAAVLGGLGGLLITPLQYTAFNVGTGLGIKGFIAAVLGGLDRVEGALAGGILLGLIEVGSTAYVSSQLQEVIVFALLLVVIVLMPKGILGVRAK